jgi:Fic family protein
MDILWVVYMFENKLNFDFRTNQLVLMLIGQIDSFRGKWEILEGKESKYFKELQKIATIESIGSSTRIEGSKLSDAEIRALINDIKIQKLESRDKQEVIGYYEALQIIYENFQTIPLSENYIKQLHTVLLKYSEKDIHHSGKYKNLSNMVVATYPNGEQKVIFNTTEPYLVSNEMEDIIKWTNEQITEKALHPLIVIGLFVYEFLSIHPFQDGNGRLSRLLANLLLVKSGYDFIQYVSFEHVIEERKKEYYRALMEGQKDRNTENEIISDWIIFFLESIANLIQKLDVKYEIFKKKGSYLNSRQQEILRYIEANQPCKIGEISSHLQQYSINTLKKDLIYLLNKKYIGKMGKKKGTLYFLFGYDPVNS